jgi:hypothetical protein
MERGEDMQHQRAAFPFDSFAAWPKMPLAMNEVSLARRV